jgi:hypothetical protein
MTMIYLVNNLFAHPLLTAVLIVAVALTLHLPYRYTHRRDRSGHEHGVWQSVLYRYEFGPDYEHLDYDGLRRLQRAILSLLCDAWALFRGNALRRLVDELRRRLGL